MAAKSLVLLVLLVLAAAAFSQAAGQCGSLKFQCKDGSQCVWGYYRCDGDSHCGDGSDEEGCDALPTVALPANASVTARVQYAWKHGGIQLHLCGGLQHCSTVWLRGEEDDGTLRHKTYTGCNRLGRGSGCTPIKYHFEGYKAFPPGEVVLEVRHRPGQLAVWRQGRPDDVVEVPVEADYATLRVRPWWWGNDMPVQFTDLQQGLKPDLDGSVRAGRWGLSLVTPAPETAPPCGNGGDYRDGACQCPPGFAGPSCETGACRSHGSQGRVHWGAVGMPPWPCNVMGLFLSHELCNFKYIRR